MKKLTWALLPLMALAFAACDDDDGPFGVTNAGTFVWHGYVRDAKSGDFINFFDTASSTTNQSDDNASVNQIWALVRGAIRTARPCQVESSTSGTQSGCFYIDNLPLAEDIPIFVRHSDYEIWNGTIGEEDPTFSPNDDPNERVELLFRDQPQFYGNVRLFPKGVNYDVNIFTSYNGIGVPDISVRCVVGPDDNAFDVVGEPLFASNSYIDPDADFNSVVSATTDANGIAVLPGAQLTKGAEYDCFAHGTDLVSGVALSCEDCLEFVVGIDDPNQKMELDDSNDDILVALYSNIDNDETEIGATGSIQIVLNRAAELFPGSADCATGSVDWDTGDGTDPAVDPVNVDDSDSEQMTISFDSTGTILTITPVFTTAPSGETGVTFEINGIFLRAQSGPFNNRVLSIGSTTSGALPGGTDDAFLTGTAGDTCDDISTFDDLDNLRSGGFDQSDTALLVR